jgi:hypothetical protein
MFLSVAARKESFSGEKFSSVCVLPRSLDKLFCNFQLLKNTSTSLSHDPYLGPYVFVLGLPLRGQVKDYNTK